MGWNAYLTATDLDGNEIEVGDWNYTHNCNEMLATALDGYQIEFSIYWAKQFGRCWWDALEGKCGRFSDTLLTHIIERFTAEPEKFKAMNPGNNWGSYDTLLPVVIEMRDAARKYPSAKWHING